jgi:circadian clock protein KaiC
LDKAKNQRIYEIIPFMNTSDENPPAIFPKALTGIDGFDQMTHGGLPRGSATLVIGGPGCGKTVFGLQTLANGASRFDEPGIFVGFEESPRTIIANAASFGWPLADLENHKLFFMDARPTVDTVTVGDFDLSGTLAILSTKVEAMKGRRIVFDSIDVLLRLLPGVVERRREIDRLHDWLLGNGLTAVITAKLDWSEKAVPFEDEAMQYLPFIVGCVVALTQKVEEDFSQRRVRIIKYRGSSYSENATALIIGPRGIEVAAADEPVLDSALTEKVSTGIQQLDEMLYGGIWRGSITMITGTPGTAKTTIGGAFAEAAAQRGERTLYVAFDETSQEIVRNLASVNIHLGEHVKNGILKVHSAYMGSGSAEQHLHRIKTLVRLQQATCLIIDPFTVFSNGRSSASTQAIAARLVRWVKGEGITLVCTSLPIHDETLSQMTSVADTWFHLEMFDGGELNRGLTILKARGTNHSNQVRELSLCSSGLSIRPPYTAEGTVLMGTMRWQKERAEREEQNRLKAEFARQDAGIVDEIAELDARVKTLARALAAKQRTRTAMADSERRRDKGEELRHTDMIQLRQSEEVGSAEATQPTPSKETSDEESSRP